MKLKLPHIHTSHASLHAKVKEGKYRKSDPAKTWRLLLLMATILLLSSLAFHFLLYTKVNNAVVVDTTADTGTEKIDAEKLTYILTYFQERVASFENTKLSAPVVTDPSL